MGSMKRHWVKSLEDLVLVITHLIAAAYEKCVLLERLAAATREAKLQARELRSELRHPEAARSVDIAISITITPPTG